MHIRAHHPSLALDSSNQPHVSMMLNVSGDDFYLDLITYQYFDGWMWSTLHRDVVESGGLMDISTLSDFCPLDIGPYDIPGLIYHDYGPGELHYARLPDTWQDGDIATASSIECATMKISAGDGWPHICYMFEPSLGNGSINYVRRSGDTYSTNPIADTGNVGPHLSMDLNSLYRPQLCYYERDLGELRYAYWGGLDWTIQVVDDQGDVGQFCDIAIDSADNPHFSYYDATHHCLKYARPAS
jgi:hypothetical protein